MSPGPDVPCCSYKDPELGIQQCLWNATMNLEHNNALHLTGDPEPAQQDGTQFQKPGSPSVLKF